MMKKWIMVLLFGSLFSTAVQAQDVLNEIVKTSLAIINDSTKDLETRKVAVFKYDAMSYLRSKVLPASAALSKSVDLDALNTNINILNEQALAMNMYITAYQKRLGEAKKKSKPYVTSIFKQATFDHKLFNDDDTEVTLAYYNRTDYPIQFCLDCDWVKTLAFIRSIDWSKM